MAYKFNPCDFLLIGWVITPVGYKNQNQIALEIRIHTTVQFLSKVGLQFQWLVSLDSSKWGSMPNMLVPELRYFLLRCLSTLQLRCFNWMELQRGMTKRLGSFQRHIQLAIRFDDKLSQFLRDVMIPNGGVIPNIHNIFLPNKKNCSSKAAMLVVRRRRRIRLIIPSLVSRCLLLLISLYS
ncbi:hypothetical protein KY285_025765 [Solanum tuberosum]|nr:hypothetical protein KY289_025695 [Solanum tuberosum]KAH0677964.1 hypothetical protein KY285_025765 [Solanum tuberosum]